LLSHYGNIAFDCFLNYSDYLLHEILNPHWGNYFYWLIAISLFVYGLEIIFPWRKNQSILREDFWLDAFYMFFNFFIFSLIGFAALSNVVVYAFNDLLEYTLGIKNLIAINVSHWPHALQLFVLFIARDFIQWNIHRALHHSAWLWKFHKLHHSVQQMGFAAHLRFHFMENVIYRMIEYIPLAMIGFGIQDFLLVHLFTILIGHLNHANIYLPLGPLRFIFNNPQMHIWHHAKNLPLNSKGVNFGLSLSIWDYVFGTVWIPGDGRDIELGFPDIENYPKSFTGQGLEPFLQNRKSESKKSQG
jgi:sterol desaturase/sphingolipid hydroxylase (fatty acid hydroxylase superfamily)